MAWYALYKWFIPWRKTPYVDYISWYKQNLYNEWFTSLSDEEQKEELERIQAICDRIKERRKRRTEMAIEGFCRIFEEMNRMGHERYW